MVLMKWRNTVAFQAKRASLNILPDGGNNICSEILLSCMARKNNRGYYINVKRDPQSTSVS